MISGGANVLTLPEPPGDGFFRRILKSPLAYSNSSRLCSVMKRSNCSICCISGLESVASEAGFEGFLGFMPLSNLNKIPRNTGENFRFVGVHGYIVFYANAPNSRHVDSGFDGNHISGNQGLCLAPRNTRRLMHLEA